MYRKLYAVSVLGLLLLGAGCRQHAEPDPDPAPAKTPGSQQLLGAVSGSFPRSPLLLTAGQTEQDPLWAVLTSRTDEAIYSPEAASGVILAQLDTSGAVQWAHNYEIGGSEGVQFARSPGQGGLLVGSIRQDLVLVRLNEQGGLAWTQRMSYLPYQQLTSRPISAPLPTADGGFLLPIAESFSGYDQEFRLLKVSSSGAIQWSWQYNMSSICSSPVVAATPDGGYAVLTGDYQRQKDFSLLKLNALGEMQWARRITAPASPYPYPPSLYMHVLPTGVIQLWWTETRGIMQAQVSADGATIISRILQLQAYLADVVARTEGTDLAVVLAAAPNSTQQVRALYQIDSQGNVVRARQLAAFPNGLLDYETALARDARGRLYGLTNAAASQAKSSTISLFKASLTDDRLCEQPTLALPSTVAGDLRIGPLFLDSVVPLTPYVTPEFIGVMPVTTTPSRGCF
ncbi:hypothetical protein SAMN06265337_0961 [Hymenobacter gelipurpurascens]|uniref:PQQ-like domain-containing protein n=1 Tax=Hymenobacter gelipurpurascens TaxID=89968 RepID=A0A212TDE0_9BACT|nr:hypothetical protein [Hymenobacter gelipurpurascens]SNC63846.1 hypothetical protein SAMN06265337_0961 [Hymenobacter gelipurpurascens]